MGKTARVMAGIPAENNTLFWNVRFLVGDPTALIELERDDQPHRIFICRDIEIQRAKQAARVNEVFCPADFTPTGGLSGDRETATAQATAECLRRNGITQVIADRTLNLLFVNELQQLEIDLACDSEWGVFQRRQKDDEEIEHLRAAQATTEEAIRMVAEWIWAANANADGVLVADGSPITSDRVRSKLDVWLMQRGYQNPKSIVACGPQGADCHEYGTGELRTEQPIILDVFPRNRTSRYNGDCTRTIVHGDISDQLANMHAAVVNSKNAAEVACCAGVTGEKVHAATTEAICAAGYSLGFPGDDADTSFCSLPHGTGHGIGLDVHEPPLLDKGGPELLVGDAVTIEPGLYCQAIGGVRVEDIVIIRQHECENLNRLPEGLVW